jgi:glutamine synthetase
MHRQHAEALQRIQERGFHHVRVGGFDIDGVLRGKYISLGKLESALQSGIGFCDVIFGWDIGDALYEDAGVSFTGWHSGYPDTLAHLEVDTLRWVPWEGGVPFILLDFYQPDGSPLEVSPRQVLRRVIDRCRKAGFEPYFASEFEFFLFRETPQSLRQKNFRNLEHLTPGMFGYSVLRASANSELVGDLVHHMRNFDLELEGIHTETGPGVYEAAIAYGPCLASADRAALFKTSAKEILAKHGVIANFMAKFSESLPGCSGHTHQSLWDLESRSNLFHDANAPNRMSDTLRWYLGGLCEVLPDFLAMFCPTINSYKRLVPGYWAPTRACWGPENRTVALRLIPGTSSKSMRIENRLVGSDANPYLAYAASLAAGLYGIENRVEPPEAVVGNGYAAPDSAGELLPGSLEAASAKLRGSKIARDFFGDAFVDHFAATRDWEVRQFRKAVTDWELARYLELV